MGLVPAAFGASAATSEMSEQAVLLQKMILALTEAVEGKQKKAEIFLTTSTNKSNSAAAA